MVEIFEEADGVAEQYGQGELHLGLETGGHFVSFIEQAAVRSVVRQQILDDLTEAPSRSG